MKIKQGQDNQCRTSKLKFESQSAQSRIFYEKPSHIKELFQSNWEQEKTHAKRKCTKSLKIIKNQDKLRKTKNNKEQPRQNWKKGKTEREKKNVKSAKKQEETGKKLENN